MVIFQGVIATYCVKLSVVHYIFIIWVSILFGYILLKEVKQNIREKNVATVMWRDIMKTL